MAYKRPLTLNSVFRAHGLIYTVVGLAANGALTCRPRGGGEARQFTYREIASAPDFRFADGELPALDASLDALPTRLRAEAERRIADLLEARTGYQAGDENLALPEEPRPQYDPAVTSLTARMKTKASELGVSVSVLYDHWNRFQTRGAAAVLDGRSTRTSDPLGRLDDRVKEAILAVHRERLAKPRISNKLLRLEVETLLKNTPETADLSVPPQRSFDRYYALLRAGDASGGPTKYQRSRAQGPQKAYGSLEPTYAGHFVLIDETDSNLWIVDPISLEVVKPTLILATDAYSRSIVAARFIIGRPNQVDAAALLRDIVTPKPFLDEWPEAARWHYVGVPEHIVLKASETEAETLAGVPAIAPQNVITDNAWIYKSHAFRDAVALLDFNVHYARLFTPTDKAALESTFGTINENFFAAQPGYKGRDVSSGADGRLEARLFLEELERAFWKWVVTFWQPREHEGLHFGCAPRLGLSPDDVYEESLARVGFLTVALSRDIYFHLLPRHLGAITREGIEFRTLTYDCDRENDLLKPFRNQKSPYPHFGGKWPIRYDDRDLRVVYLQDPRDGAWLPIPWREAHLVDQPFGSDTRDIAVELAKSRGRHVPTKEAVTDAIREIIQRREQLAPRRGKELAVAKRQRAREQQLLRDRAAAEANGNGISPGPRTPGSEQTPTTNGNGSLRGLDDIPRLEALEDMSEESAG